MLSCLSFLFGSSRTQRTSSPHFIILSLNKPQTGYAECYCGSIPTCVMQWSRRSACEEPSGGYFFHIYKLFLNFKRGLKPSLGSALNFLSIFSFRVLILFFVRFALFLIIRQTWNTTSPNKNSPHVFLECWWW